MPFRKKEIFKTRSQRFKSFVDAINDKTRFPAVRAIVSGKDGKVFAYIKEIKEIDNVLLVRLRGNIDSYTIPLMKTDNTEPPNRHILLDFKDVIHIDSATLASLLMLLTVLKMKGRKLGIINATPLLTNYLKVAKLTALVRIYPDEKTAVKDLRKVS